MSAGRNASTLLFTLVATIILMAVFAGVSSLNVLEKHAYMPEFGWNQPAVNTPNGIISGVCAPTTATSGFPLAYNRQADLPRNCLKATNPLARSINYALYFAAAGIVAVAVVESIRSRIP